MLEEIIKVLIVEDNPGDLELIRLMLREDTSTRFEIYHASTLSRGIATLKEKEIDVVLLDLGLPDSMGIKTIETLEKEAVDVPVIVLTGMEDSRVVAQAVRLGAQDYLVKGDFELTLLRKSIMYAIERKKIEHRLRETNERMTTIIRLIPSSLSITTFEDGKYIDLNEAFEMITGFHREEVLGKTVTELGIMDRLVRERIKNEIMTAGFVRNFEVNIRRKSGEIISGLFAGRMINMEGQQALLSVITDITERIRAVEQIRHYLSQLEENKKILEKNAAELRAINAGKDKLFSIVAHDLRSPFSALLGFSEYLSQNSQELTPDEIREFSGRIYSSLKKVLQLVENLLEWARLQSGKIEFVFTDFDINELIRDVIDVHQVNFVRKDILVDYSACSNPLMVHADKNSIETVLRNLLSNAIKFSYPGGRVEITTTCNEHTADVAVRDYGIGISEEDMAKIFRIETNYTRHGTGDEKGTGLGLVLCREFIESNHGKIAVSSVINEGSTFSFTIPKARQ